MNLKLAEYNADGKFERFLELGQKSDHFGYFGDAISYIEEKSVDPFVWINHFLVKDPKDPLNRFDGLFHGRTYGDGRFVLIIDDCDKVIEIKNGNESRIISQQEYVGQGYWKKINDRELSLGNLHENPELYSKIK